MAIPTIFVASIAMYAAVALSGDPLAKARAVDPPPSAEVIRSLEIQYGLDKPLWLRYWDWLVGVVQGDFGVSFQGYDIGDELIQRLGVTLKLLAAVLVVAVILAIVIGLVSSMKQFSVVDNTLSITVYVLLAMPVFWLGILLKNAAVVFNESQGKTILYTIGDAPLTPGPWYLVFAYLALPTLALMPNIVGSWSRYVRASLIEVSNLDYMRLARAKGLSKWEATYKHGLRNALLPFITVSTLEIGALIGGAVVTETVFQWRGMGDLLLRAIETTDINVVMAWLLVFAVVIVLMNLVADVLYGIVDPRIRRA